jgi:hypothetical protein
MDKEQELFLLKITAQYVAEVRAGRQPSLSDYLVRYPCYADAIADFVAYYHAVEEMIPAMDAMLSMDAVPSTDATLRGCTLNQVSANQVINCEADAINQVPANQAINRVSTNRVMNCQDEMPLASSQQDEQVEGVAFAGTVTTLLTTATGQRLTLSQLATKLDLSIDIVLLLEQRSIAPVTIPRVLCEEISLLLQQPSAMVQRYLYSLDQRKLTSTAQKRNQQMKIAEEEADYSALSMMDKPSFRAIVEKNLQLSAEQRSRWCTILDAEGI